MQKVKLPLTVDPVKDAQQRIDYDGYYTASQLVRLAESTGKVLSDAQVTLSFYIDPQKLVVMKGQVQVDVELECQRCGEPFKQTLECHFMYSPVEDELILALPLVPMHSSEHCEVSAHEQVFGELPEELAKKPNPFAVLANLKQK